MIFAVLLVVTVFTAAEAADKVTLPPSTTATTPLTTPIPAKVLLDIKHAKAMIVRADGCYEYNISQKDLQDIQNPMIRTIEEAIILEHLSTMVSRQELDHSIVDNMTQEIRTACASLTVYSFTS